MSDYLIKDYEGFRQELISLIPKKLPEWTDNSSSDAGIVFLELFCHGLDIISYYQDRIFNEVYLPTAEDRQSIIDICKLLNYRLQEAAPATTTVVFGITASSSDLTIPKGFQISTESTNDEDPIIFETDDELVIPVGATGLEKDEAGNYLYSVSATQGITIYNQILGSSTGQVNQEFKLSYPNAIGKSIEVYVDEGAGFILWTDVTDELVQLTDTGRQYWREIDSDGYAWIKFGSGLDGNIPAEGLDNIEATYRVGGGAKTNVGRNTITRVISQLSRVQSVTNIIAATGGSDPETIEEARRNAPLYLRSTDKAVTKSDYQALAYNVDGVVKSYAEVDKGNNLQVNIYVITDNDFDEETVHKNVEDYLDERKMITTQVSVSEGEKIYFDIDLTASIYDTYKRSTISSYVDEIIEEEFDSSVREFGQGETIFDLYPLIGSIEGLTNLVINKFTIVPKPKHHTISGTCTWSDIKVNASNTLKGTWRVMMTSATQFTVSFSTTGLFGGEEVTKGTGAFNTVFNSTGGEITFTITSGATAMSTGDYWTFKTTGYKDDISIASNEFMVLGNATITVTGGVA